MLTSNDRGLQDRVDALQDGGCGRGGSWGIGGHFIITVNNKFKLHKKKD